MAFNKEISLVTYELDPSEDGRKYKDYFKIQKMEPGDGLVGIVWETGKVHHWGSIGREKRFLRGVQAKPKNLSYDTWPIQT